MVKGSIGNPGRRPVADPSDADRQATQVRPAARIEIPLPQRLPHRPPARDEGPAPPRCALAAVRARPAPSPVLPASSARVPASQAGCRPRKSVNLCAPACTAPFRLAPPAGVRFRAQKLAGQLCSQTRAYPRAHSTRKRGRALMRDTGFPRNARNPDSTMSGICRSGRG
jgi:hypothetical protein